MSTHASFTDAQALTALLSAEGFLLATVSLAVTLGTPGRKGVPNLPFRPPTIAMTAGCLSALLAVGGLLAWLGLYGQGSLLPPRELAIAAILLLAVVGQPVLAVILAMGARMKE